MQQRANLLKINEQYRCRSTQPMEVLEEQHSETNVASMNIAITAASLKLPPAIRLRGKPRGHRMTAFRNKKRKRSTSSRTQSFHQKTTKDNENSKFNLIWTMISILFSTVVNVNYYNSAHLNTLWLINFAALVKVIMKMGALKIWSATPSSSLPDIAVDCFLEHSWSLMC